jgi:D-aspartate ligase
MLDKERTYELARSIGIPAPRTVQICLEDELPGSLGELSFPIALKPRRSHLFARHFGLTQKVFVAADRRQLADHTERLRALGIELLGCEIIPGPDDAYYSYYSFIDDGGEPLLHLTKHKLRQYPPGFGLATYHEIDRDPEVAELGLRFFKGVGLRGLGNVEFKRDARDDRLVLIECNPRFTAGQEIVRHAGIDLALLAYNRLAGKPLPPLDGYRAGVRMLHPVEDLRGALELRRRGRLGLRSWAASLLHKQHFPLFSWRDPRPSLHSWARFARRGVSR